MPLDQTIEEDGKLDELVTSKIKKKLKTPNPNERSCVNEYTTMNICGKRLGIIALENVSRGPSVMRPLFKAWKVRLDKGAAQLVQNIQFQRLSKQKFITNKSSNTQDDTIMRISEDEPVSGAKKK
jgi:hypothetical protein